MTALGFALLIAGAALVIAEAHVPGGVLGVVRSWTEPSGQVFVDGALWRARHEWPLDDDQLQEGDAVVVERVSGLTLCVRRADEWELTA
jgi:membrane-bound serine protease (ClpP class)